LHGESLTNVITTVVSEFKWPPEVIGGLFFDAEDHEGLFHWYNVCVKIHEQIKPKE
jgi:hypothetical protein